MYAKVVKFPNRYRVKKQKPEAEWRRERERLQYYAGEIRGMLDNSEGNHLLPFFDTICQIAGVKNGKE